MVWLWTNQADMNHSHTTGKRDNQLGLDDAYRHLFCNITQQTRKCPAQQ